MKANINILLLIIYITVTNSYLYTDLKDRVLLMLKSPIFISIESESDEQSSRKILLPNLVVPKTLYTTDELEYDEDLEIYHDEDTASDDLLDIEVQKPLESFFLKDPENNYVIKKRPRSRLMNMARVHFNNNNKQKRIDLSKYIKTPKLNILYPNSSYPQDLNQVEKIKNNFRRALRPIMGKETEKPKEEDGDGPRPTTTAKPNNTESESDTSSTRENENQGSGVDWKQEWLHHWTEKKDEALNSSKPYTGDAMNILSGRPWGVPCGDPSQADVPWGTCVYKNECEAEYRIYRGDFFCGATTFICCSLQHTNYDLYEGIDFSFQGKSLSTATEEKHILGQQFHSNEKERRRLKYRKKRYHQRKAVKTQLSKKIEHVMSEVHTVLMNLETNSSKNRRRKTKMMKQFIKALKRQFKNDRNSIRELHNELKMKVDIALMHELNLIASVNHQFAKNETFRNIILSGTITREGARILGIAFPKLRPLLPFHRHGIDIEAYLATKTPKRQSKRRS